MSRSLRDRSIRCTASAGSSATYTTSSDAFLRATFKISAAHASHVRKPAASIAARRCRVPSSEFHDAAGAVRHVSVREPSQGRRFSIAARHIRCSGMRAGRLAARTGVRGRHRHRPWARRERARLRDGRLSSRATRAPLVFNPQGLEEFGATDPSRAPLKRLGYWPLRVAVRRTAQAADRVIATDRSLVEPGHRAPGRQQSGRFASFPTPSSSADCDRPACADRGGRRCAPSLGLQPDDVLLVSVGRLEANKGFRRADSRARRRSRDRTRCLRAGDGCSSATVRCACELQRELCIGRARRPSWCCAGRAECGRAARLV